MSLRGRRRRTKQPLKNIATLRDWLTGDVLSPALRAHYVRPKSLPAILSLRSQRRGYSALDKEQSIYVVLARRPVTLPRPVVLAQAIPDLLPLVRRHVAVPLA